MWNKKISWTNKTLLISGGWGVPSPPPYVNPSDFFISLSKFFLEIFFGIKFILDHHQELFKGMGRPCGSKIRYVSFTSKYKMIQKVLPSPPWPSLPLPKFVCSPIKILSNPIFWISISLGQIFLAQRIF